MKWQGFALLAGLSIALLSGCGAPSSTTGGNAYQTTGSSNSTTSTANQTAATASPAAAIGHMAPNFDLAQLGGTGNVSLSKLLANGEPILLNAWASWCPPCQMETPDLIKMSQKYKGQMQFVGVDMTTQETNPKDASAFVKKYGIPYSVLMDTQGTFLNAYALQGFPTTFVISPKGKILDVEFGMMTAERMQTVIQQAIAASK
ncbi:MAG: hypothetical protein A2201_00700 [Alicyclobacillus sp. RIFOXYA1_FULL_53_8]|nr:MAG: hypothetical protein A2201_00700 [Alicyclobacillus sp. RIFOXYA1_FULL_53_8]